MNGDPAPEIRKRRVSQAEPREVLAFNESLLHQTRSAVDIVDPGLVCYLSLGRQGVISNGNAGVFKRLRPLLRLVYSHRSTKGLSTGKCCYNIRLPH